MHLHYEVLRRPMESALCSVTGSGPSSARLHPMPAGGNLRPMSDPDPGLTVAPPATRGAALGVALAALERLAELGETIEDEWPYVTALAEAGRTRLGSAAGPDPAVPLAPDRAAAVAAACAEIARITDPHRAIDWLSTFPAVVELALAAPAAPRPAAS
jgi:hypothetical protein